MFFIPFRKKNRYQPFGLITVFLFFDLIDEVKPLPTLLLVENNYSFDEYENNANKVVNGNSFTHMATFI